MVKQAEMQGDRLLELAQVARSRRGARHPRAAGAPHGAAHGHPGPDHPPHAPARPAGGGRAGGQPALPQAARGGGRASSMPLDLRDTPDGLRLRVRVQPRASRDGLLGEREGALVVRLTAPPLEGRANQALARLLGKALGVAPSAVRVVRGEAGRDKLVAVAGVERRRGAGAAPVVIAADFAVRRIGLLATLAGQAPRTLAGMRELGLREHAALAAAGGGIAWVGDDREFDGCRLARPGRRVARRGRRGGRARLRRRPHAPGVRGRPRRRDPAAPGRRELRRRSRPRAAASCARSTPRARRRSRSWPRSSARGSTRCCCAARPLPRSRAATASRPGAELRSLEAIRLAACATPRHRRPDLPRRPRGPAGAPRRARTLRRAAGGRDDPGGGPAPAGRLCRRLLRARRLRRGREPAHPGRRAPARAEAAAARGRAGRRPAARGWRASCGRAPPTTWCSSPRRG